MTSDALLRNATPEDTGAVRDLLLAAFGRHDEAMLVGRLRHGRAVIVELLAELDGEVVGHVLFSNAPITTAEGHRIAGAVLGPLAVLPEHQGRGIGSALVTAGLKLCRARGIGAVLVLGDPAFYGRFGFDQRLGQRLRGPFAGPAFQALELVPAILARGGEVRYPDAFLA